MPTSLRRYLLRLSIAIGLTMGTAAAVNAEESSYSIQQADQATQAFLIPELQKPILDFEKIEAFARELYVKSATHVIHERALGYFYRLLGKFMNDPVQFASLMEWRKERPQSPVAILAEMQAAQSAVMTNFQPSLITRAVWREGRQSRSIFERTRQDLLRHKSLASVDPHWYVLMAQVSIALARPTSEVADIVREGLKKHPGNYELVLVSGNAALSKWANQPPALDAWSALVADASPPVDKAANYARVYLVAMQAQYGAEIYELATIDWDRLMSSLRSLVERHPSDLVLNQAALAACLGGNRSLTKSILTDSRFEYSDFTWYDIGTTEAPFAYCKDWISATDVPDDGVEKPIPTASQP